MVLIHHVECGMVLPSTGHLCFWCCRVGWCLRGIAEFQFGLQAPRGWRFPVCPVPSSGEHSPIPASVGVLLETAVLRDCRKGSHQGWQWSFSNRGSLFGIHFHIGWGEIDEQWNDLELLCRYWTISCCAGPVCCPSGGLGSPDCRSGVGWKGCSESARVTSWALWWLASGQEYVGRKTLVLGGMWPAIFPSASHHGSVKQKGISGSSLF